MQCTPPHSAIAPRHICPPGVWPARNGKENPAQTDHGSAITAGVPPSSPRNLAPCLSDYSGRLPARGSRVRPHRTWPGLGEVAAGCSRTAGERYRGRRPAINCQRFTAVCIFKPSRRARLIRPVKPVSRLAGTDEGFWHDCPLPWPIVRMGDGHAVRPPGGTGPESSAPPGHGRRPACCARGLAPSRD